MHYELRLRSQRSKLVVCNVPPLCFIDVSSGVVPEESKEILKENMSEEDFCSYF